MDAPDADSLEEAGGKLLTFTRPHADLFGNLGRAWLLKQPLPDDERIAIERHMGELDRLGDELTALDKEIAGTAMLEPCWSRLHGQLRRRQGRTSGSSKHTRSNGPRFIRVRCRTT